MVHYTGERGVSNTLDRKLELVILDWKDWSRYVQHLLQVEVRQLPLVHAEVLGTMLLKVVHRAPPTLWNGEMKLEMQTMPPSAKSLDTSLIRRMFSSLSSGENPKFLFSPVLTLSPSST